MFLKMIFTFADFMNKEFFFISGLPRTGSTLLCNIISQREDTYVEPNSPICQLLFGIEEVCQFRAYEAILRSNKLEFENILLSEVANLWYNKINKKNIIDKSRYWTINPKYMSLITKTPKCLVLIRPITEIVKSFIKLKKQNNNVLSEYNLLIDGRDPTFSAIQGVAEAFRYDQDLYLFGTYDQFIKNPEEFLNQVYNFWGIDNYRHNFNTIIPISDQGDKILGTPNLHESRIDIKKNNYEFLIPNPLWKRVQEMDEALWYDYEQAKTIWPHRFIDIRS